MTRRLTPSGLLDEMTKLRMRTAHSSLVDVRKSNLESGLGWKIGDDLWLSAVCWVQATLAPKGKRFSLTDLHRHVTAPSHPRALSCHSQLFTPSEQHRIDTLDRVTVFPDLLERCSVRSGNPIAFEKSKPHTAVRPRKSLGWQQWPAVGYAVMPIQPSSEPGDIA